MHFWIALIWTAGTLWAAAKKPSLPPYRDPADQLARMAPMTKSSRSVVANLGNELHLAFDTERLRTHTVWRGNGLNLYGPGYHGAKRPFICHPGGDIIWGNPPVPSWSIGNNSKSVSHKYLSYSTRAGRVTYHTRLDYSKHPATDIQLSVYSANQAVVRSLRLTETPDGLAFLAHAEIGKPVELQVAGAAAIQRENDVLVALVKGSGAPEIKLANLQFEEEQFTEQGSNAGNQFLKTDQAFAQIWVPILQRSETQIDIITLTAPTIPAARRLAAEWKHAKVEFSDPKPTIHPANPRARRSFVIDPHYEAESLPLPDTKTLNLFVTGMDWLSRDQLAVCTYTGEVWIVEGATGPAKEMKFRRFTRGMNEPMGLLVKDGYIHLGNKAEITRLKDSDRDGIADVFERISSDWDYTGSYNSFSYGPVLDREGNFVVANAGHAGHWGARHMGWALRVGPGGGKAVPFAEGFREPNGIKAIGANRDLFVTDNQGAWIGACKISHIKPGRYYGHPTSRPAPRELYGKSRELAPPAIWFPYKWVRSASDLVEITDDRFGPFKGQILAGDFQNAVITRVQLEQVNGEWQGAVWPFLKGFQSGVNRMVMGADGHLYVGGGKVKAWAANAPAFHALERVKFKNKIPFSVQKVRALTDGFELTFTQPVDRESALLKDGYDAWQYRYAHHKSYGSPEYDHDGKRDSFTVVQIDSVRVSDDNRKVILKIAGWKPGFVTGVRSLDIRSTEGSKLWHDTFYYTLNQIPAQ